MKIKVLIMVVIMEIALYMLVHNIDHLLTLRVIKDSFSSSLVNVGAETSSFSLPNYVLEPHLATEGSSS